MKTQPVAVDKQAVKATAQSVFQQLRANGYSDRDIISVSAELIELLTQDMHEQGLKLSA